MIPKIIHYCWFGRGKKSKLINKCIQSWRQFCPDYEIIEWNEDNYDLSSAPLFVKQALEAKKWAFVVDYIRYQVVYEHGGIYLDTDVQVLKSLDILLESKAFFGMQYDNIINSGLGFGAEKGVPILKQLMKTYEDIPFVLPDGQLNTKECPLRDAPIFEAHGFIPDGSEQILEGDIHIYPLEYFCPRSFFDGKLRITENTMTIHWFAGSWLPLKTRLRFGRNRLIRRVLGQERARRIKHTLIRKR